jgi:hypothetical protein
VHELDGVMSRQMEGNGKLGGLLLRASETSNRRPKSHIGIHPKLRKVEGDDGDKAH